MLWNTSDQYHMDGLAQDCGDAMIANEQWS